ncbi:hypothetical protein GMJAKD_12260 [Candidatus Electrothrix aarhusensis]
MVTSMNLRHRIKKVLIGLDYKSEPDFLIIGAQKAGTTVLHSYISCHPDITRPVNKEAHFFDIDENYNRGYKLYYKNFSLPIWMKAHQITFEATPDYLHDVLVPSRIHKYNPNIKMIIVLRDPVKRAYSAWNMHHNLFPNHPKHYWLADDRSFEQAVEDDKYFRLDERDPKQHVNRGKYVEQLENYFKFFSKDQILILDNEELNENLEKTLAKVYDFLGIKEVKLRDLNIEKNIFWDNKGFYSKAIGADLEKMLYAFYRPYDERLEELLGRKFSWFVN